MNIADLKTLEAVARHGNMSKAAAELHTVQSNITSRIRTLEDALGLPLFRRHARGVTPTPAAERMLPYVGRITQLMADAEKAARDEGAPAGPLTIGGLETTTALRLSPLLADFAARFPEVRLTIRTGTTAGLLRDVVEHRLDGAFVAGPVEHTELLQEPMFTEELVLVTGPGVDSLNQLHRMPDVRTLVFAAGCSYRQRLETLLAGMGMPVTEPMEFGSLDAILGCVAAGIGISLLPEGVARDAAEAGSIAVHRLPRKTAQVETLFVRRSDGYLSSALAAFLDTARAFHQNPLRVRTGRTGKRTAGQAGKSSRQRSGPRQ